MIRRNKTVIAITLAVLLLAALNYTADAAENASAAKPIAAEAQMLELNITYTPTAYPEGKIITPADIQSLPAFERTCAVMAQMFWGEARGETDRGIAATGWCACNRALHATGRRAPEDVLYQIIKDSQFHGYDEANPVEQKLYDIAQNVLIQWMMEPYTSVGIDRVIPEDYLWFSSVDNDNVFRNAYLAPYDCIVIP